jgi:hypothetical protein
VSALRDAIDAAAPRGPRCTVCRLLDELPEDYRDDLDDLFAGPFTSTQIAGGLAKIAKDERQPSWAIAAGTLQRHRKGDCLSGRAS